jgi:hypothetical protein
MRQRRLSLSLSTTPFCAHLSRIFEIEKKTPDIQRVAPIFKPNRGLRSFSDVVKVLPEADHKNPGRVDNSN